MAVRLREVQMTLFQDWQQTGQGSEPTGLRLICQRLKSLGKACMEIPSDCLFYVSIGARLVSCLGLEGDSARTLRYARHYFRYRRKGIPYPEAMLAVIRKAGFRTEFELSLIFDFKGAIMDEGTAGFEAIGGEEYKLGTVLEEIWRLGQGYESSAICDYRIQTTESMIRRAKAM